MKLNKSKTLIAALVVAVAGSVLAFGRADMGGLGTVSLEEVAARSEPSFLIDEVVYVGYPNNVKWLPNQPNIATMIVQHHINRVWGTDLELTGRVDLPTRTALEEKALDAYLQVSEAKRAAAVLLGFYADLPVEETFDMVKWLGVLEAIGFYDVTVDDIVENQCKELADALRDAGASTDKVYRSVEAAWTSTRCTLNLVDGNEYGPWAVSYGGKTKFTRVGPPRVWIESWGSAASAYLAATGES